MPNEQQHRTLKSEESYHEDKEVKTLLRWKAKERPYRKKRREYFLLILFIAFCFTVILFLAKEWMLIFAVWSIAFLAVALAVTEPKEIEHRITAQGVITEEHTYLYKELYDFWFVEKNGNKILHIRTYAFFPGVLSLLLGDLDEQIVRDLLVKYLPYREVVKKTFFDNAELWLSKNFPLESTN